MISLPADAEVNSQEERLPAGNHTRLRADGTTTLPQQAVQAPLITRASSAATDRAMLHAHMPVISSLYGNRRDPIEGNMRAHKGIDIAGRHGTPIMAAANGHIHFAGTAGSYGNMVEIIHANGLTTRYAHLSAFHVSPGQIVTQGQIIASMGSTGRSTGPHLHFEVRDRGQPRNPLDYIGNAPIRPQAISYLAPSPDRHMSQFSCNQQAQKQAMVSEKDDLTTIRMRHDDIACPLPSPPKNAPVMINIQPIS